MPAASVIPQTAHVPGYRRCSRLTPVGLVVAGAPSAESISELKCRDTVPVTNVPSYVHRSSEIA